MKRLTILLPVLACLSVVSSPALARENGLYGGVFVGDRLGKDQTLAGANVAGAPRVVETPTKDGVVGGGVLGAVVADASWGRLRAEAEFTSSKNDIKNLSLNGMRRELLTGRKSVTTMMLNAAYDTPKISDRVRLTVGGGAGAAAIDYAIEYNVAAAGPRIQIPTNATGKLALQAIGGVSIEIAKNFELTADARYMHVNDHSVERFNFTAGTLDSVLKAKYNSASLTTGFRLLF
ncbi:outer membrane beta-barrel protein [Sphingomonadaceae bacterium OTU29THOMA1]|nr:outer membrane beta-barrel protein [Sphingomonadaceae bacterium OTU29THOMA1]